MSCKEVMLRLISFRFHESGSMEATVKSPKGGLRSLFTDEAEGVAKFPERCFRKSRIDEEYVHFFLPCY